MSAVAAGPKQCCTGRGGAWRGAAWRRKWGQGPVEGPSPGGWYGECELDVGHTTSGMFCYRCWDVEVAVVDFSRQRRSTRWLRRMTEEPT